MKLLEISFDEKLKNKLPRRGIEYRQNSTILGLKQRVTEKLGTTHFKFSPQKRQKRQFFEKIIFILQNFHFLIPGNGSDASNPFCREFCNFEEFEKRVLLDG